MSNPVFRASPSLDVMRNCKVPWALQVGCWGHLGGVLGFKGIKSWRFLGVLGMRIWGFRAVYALGLEREELGGLVYLLKLWDIYI